MNIDIDFTGKIMMKSYKLKARAHETSIDFYEVAGTLTRNNPIAFLSAGAKSGFVLVHKQLLRQAEGKRNHIVLVRESLEESDVEFTFRLQGATEALTPPGLRQSFPWKFGNAFAFNVDTPAEFTKWKAWAERVRQASWNIEEREYTVTFPEV